MTTQEVISSEYPLKPIEKENELEYQNINLGNGFTTRLFYSFMNGRLSSLNYIVKNEHYLKSNCKKAIPLTDKVKYINYIFNALERKGFKCDRGWTISNKTNLHLETGLESDLKNCNKNEELLSLINKIAKREKSDRVSITLENKTTSVQFIFNEFQNYDVSEGLPESAKIPCNDNSFQTLFWMKFEPNYLKKAELNKNRF